MLTSKQRSRLRSCANKMETIIQIGKDGIDEAVITQVEDALFARELIKLRVLDTCPLSARETAFELERIIGCEGVQIIGSRLVLYKRNPEKHQFDDIL